MTLVKIGQSQAERRVTIHSGDMGYTPGLLRGEQKCPGRSVTTQTDLDIPAEVGIESLP